MRSYQRRHLLPTRSRNRGGLAPCQRFRGGCEDSPVECFASRLASIQRVQTALADDGLPVPRPLVDPKDCPGIATSRSFGRGDGPTVEALPCEEPSLRACIRSSRQPDPSGGSQGRSATHVKAGGGSAVVRTSRFAFRLRGHGCWGGMDRRPRYHRPTSLGHITSTW